MMPFPFAWPFPFAAPAGAFFGWVTGGGCEAGVCGWLLMDVDCDAALRFLDGADPLLVVWLAADGGLAAGCGSLVPFWGVLALLSSDEGSGFRGAGPERTVGCKFVIDPVDCLVAFLGSSSRLS